MTATALRKLKASRLVAMDNLEFYELLYDDMEDTVERDNIGRAMAQKQSYIGAIEAILKNHEISVLGRTISALADDEGDVLQDTEAGEHLTQEERFYASVQACMSEIEDELTVELLNNHLKAAELAVTTIKATSLII